MNTLTNTLTENPRDIYEGKVIVAIVPTVPERIRQSYVNRLLHDEPALKDIICYNTIEELFPKFSEHRFHTDFVTIDIESLHNHQGANYFELIKTLRTLINCTVRRDSVGQTVKRNTRMIAAAGASTDHNLIKETAGLVDYITIRAGSIWSYDDVRDDVHEYVHGATGISKKIQPLLRPIKRTTIKLSQKKDEIQLTPRQRQIFNLISTRGASNKTIARLLDISESTVKLHTSAILKKYGVKNRTQLAIFTKDKEKV